MKNFRERAITLSLLSFFTLSILYAQDAPIRGHVRDKKGEPVVGATITAAENSATAITDLNGDFSIDVPAGTKIEVTFIGLLPEKKKAVDNMIITMKDRRSLSWNVRAGTHFSFYTLPDDFGGATLVPGFQLGFGVDIPFNATWSLQPSVVLITKRSEYNTRYYASDIPDIPIEGNDEWRGEARQSAYGNSNSGIDINPLFLQIPVIISARFSLSNKINMVIGAGPYASYYLAGRVSDSQDEWSEDLIDNDFEGKFDWGLAAEVKVEIGKFFVGLNGNLALKELIPDGTSDSERFKIHTAGLLVGFNF